MKRISIILAVLLVAASCGTTSRGRITTVSFASYEDYPDMWISPNDCPLNHKALGSLYITVRPAFSDTRQKVQKDNIYEKGGIYQAGADFGTEIIGFDELLGMAVQEARARHANGISNLRISKSASGDYEVTGLLVQIE